ncbi:MAG: hypothetical protein JJT99_09430 [Rhodobacteraceae bacterium]|nr:hypothetical protein [Paracoccaceae bacterium]
MDYATLFLMGVYLIPLAVISALSAWADERRPALGIVLLLCAAALLGWVWQARPDGLYPIREIPELTVVLAARILAMF